MYHTVRLKVSDIDVVEMWAIRNCKSFVSSEEEIDVNGWFTGVPFTGYVDYRFRDEADAVFFALTWC